MSDQPALAPDDDPYGPAQVFPGDDDPYGPAQDAADRAIAEPPTTATGGAPTVALARPNPDPRSLARFGSWGLLAVVALSLLAATVAVPLMWRARADAQAVRRFADDDLMLAASAAEIRVLTLRLRLGATRAARTPADASLGAAYRADRARLADELRSARLSTRDRAIVDVADDLENRVLAFDAAAQPILAAPVRADAGRGDLPAMERLGGEVADLSDELETAVLTSVEGHARALRSGGRAALFGVLGVVSAAVAVLAGALVLRDPGGALPARVWALLPASLGGALTRGAAPRVTGDPMLAARALAPTVAADALASPPDAGSADLASMPGWTQVSALSDAEKEAALGSAHALDGTATRPHHRRRSRRRSMRNRLSRRAAPLLPPDRRC